MVNGFLAGCFGGTTLVVIGSVDPLGAATSNITHQLSAAYKTSGLEKVAACKRSIIALAEAVETTAEHKLVYHVYMGWIDSYGADPLVKQMLVDAYWFFQQRIPVTGH